MAEAGTHKARRRTASVLFALALPLVTAGPAVGLPSFSTAPKSSPGSGGQAELFGVASACHPTFDRFVVRARSARPGYDVRYVQQVLGEGSGDPIPLLGTKRIRVLLRPARGHTSGGANLVASVLTPLCSNLRQVRTAGDFEGVVSFGLGIRRRTGFRVFRLTDPARIVVDVAH
jgi:hypothetical protein